MSLEQKLKNTSIFSQSKTQQGEYKLYDFSEQISQSQGEQRG